MRKKDQIFKDKTFYIPENAITKSNRTKKVTKANIIAFKRPASGWLHR